MLFFKAFVMQVNEHTYWQEVIDSILEEKKDSFFWVILIVCNWGLCHHIIWQMLTIRQRKLYSSEAKGQSEN